MVYFYQIGSDPLPLVLHGRVTDTGGVPLSGAMVSATVGLTLVTQVPTDANGNYALPSLGAGVYLLWAGDATHQTAIRGLTLSAATSLQNFQLSLMPGTPATQAVNRRPDLSYTIGPNGSALKVFDRMGFVAITTNNAPSSGRMTIVLTHGWNSDPAAWASNMASLFRADGVTTNMANIVAWDWRTNALGPIFPPAPPVDKTSAEGVALGQALLGLLGAGYSQPIHFMGHSLGALVNAAAANYLHGTNTAQQAVSPTRWPWSRTHITIFDHAEQANLAGREVLFDGLNPTALDAFNAAFSEENTTQNWMPALPLDFAWADNYVSLVGFSKARAVNVWLQKAALEIGASAKHSYPMNWYGRTISNPPGAQVGFQRSREYGLVVGLPTAAFPPSGLSGAYYQPLVGSDPLALQPLLAVAEIPNFVAGKAVQAVAGVVQFAGAVTTTIQNAAQTAGQAIASGFNYVGGVAAQGRQAVVNFCDSAVLRLRLHTTPGGAGNGSGGAQTASVGAPPMAWLPIQFPANATAMAFDFTVEGHPRDDVLVCGIGTNNLFSLEAKYIPTNTMSSSRLIDVSEWAGTTNELFFGFLGRTSTNATMTIENIRFFSLAEPRLEILVSGSLTLLSWPLTAGGYVLESTPTLTSPTWEAAANAPVISAGSYVVTNTWSDQARFFRLRQR